ncbi:hypothetical protein E2562_029292 [Oryza meyeriana var. granulata]|uniref:Uncharacterized protein n=1 Tax=Oryza meyeriana var. granulata TaxID=110450 RepID=A0A6G1BNM5_9ORYZ|nr:hypothetical protein E2562_029292 [Oryza meyeriana var. granulata]
MISSPATPILAPNIYSLPLELVRPVSIAAGKAQAWVDEKNVARLSGRAVESSSPAANPFFNALLTTPKPTSSSSTTDLPEGAQWRYNEFLNAVKKGKVECVRFSKDGGLLQSANSFPPRKKERRNPRHPPPAKANAMVETCLSSAATAASKHALLFSLLTLRL